MAGFSPSFFPGERDFPRPPENSDLSGILSKLNDSIEKLLQQYKAYAPTPTQQYAPVPPPMPGSAAALSAAGAGQYGSAAVGPERFQPYQSPLGQYRGHAQGDEAFNIGNVLGRDLLGAMPAALAGAGNYAAAKTPYGTTGTTDMLGMNLQMGMLKQLAGFADKIPVLGAYASKQFEGLEEAVYAPEQRARGRLSPTFERMAMAGVQVDDKEIQEAFRFALPMERRGIYMKQRLDRIGAAMNAENGSALSGALSQIGF